MFINFSNHPSAEWSEKQKAEACRLGGEIRDLAFPAVGADMTAAEVGVLAEECIAKITALDPSCVMCQGEFTLAFAVILGLMRRGVRVLAACSERCVETVNNTDGTVTKKILFKFKGFRDFIM